MIAWRLLKLASAEKKKARSMCFSFSKHALYWRSLQSLFLNNRYQMGKGGNEHRENE